MKKIIAAAAGAFLLAGCGTEIGPVEVRDSYDGSAGDVLEVSSLVNDESAGNSSVTDSSVETTEDSNSGKKFELEEKLPQSIAGKIGSMGVGSGETIYLTTYTDLEAGSVVRIKDLIAECNAEPVYPDKLVDTMTTGWHEQEILLKDGTSFVKQYAQYNVADYTPPVFLDDGNGHEIQTGSAFEPWDFISFGDSFDSSPSLTVYGDVDTSTPGSYQITAEIMDASGNSSSRSITVYVTDNADNTVYWNYDRIPFSDFSARYSGEGRSLGMDVSAWQGSIDYDAIKAAGCQFVIIRVGYCRGNAVEDDYFEQNLRNAKAAGLKVGVYFYSSDNSPDEVRDHAHWIIEKLDGAELDLPVAFDWEDFGNFNSYGMSFADLNRLYLTFKKEIEASGYETMLYSSRNFLYDVWQTEDETVWLAHYVDETNYEGDYLLWQRCGWGRINGIDGDCDFDVMYEN